MGKGTVRVAAWVALVGVASSSGCATARVWQWFQDNRSRSVNVSGPRTAAIGLAEAGRCPDGSLLLWVVYGPRQGGTVTRPAVVPPPRAAPAVAAPPWRPLVVARPETPQRAAALTIGQIPVARKSDQAVFLGPRAGPTAVFGGGEVEVRGEAGELWTVAWVPPLPGPTRVVAQEPVLSAYLTFAVGLPVAVVADATVFAAWVVLKWIGSVGPTGWPR